MGRSNNPNIAEDGKPHRWRKGQSGNPSGRPKSKMLSDAYKYKLEEPVPNDPEGRTWAELIAEAQVRDAVRGNVQAAREIADRLGVIDSDSPEFVPNDAMEKGPDGWVWSCSKHKDPSREAAVQALIKSGLLGGSRP